MIYLVDGTALCYRSFFAIKLSTNKGFPTGAVYGFYQTLRKIISQYNPSHLGICFDVSRKTFRSEKFKEYKIHRPPLPEGLKVQIPLIRQLIEALGITIIEKAGFEADDLIASLCQKAVQDNLEVVIVTIDKDLYQLIASNKVSIYNYNKDKLMKKEEFKKEYGFEPKLMVDYLSLTGDSTDNIPGAKGIGKVGAVRLISEFGRLDNIFANLNKLPPKLKEILSKNKKNIFLSKELVELASCDLELAWEDLKLKKTDQQKVYKIFRDLQFNAFLKDLAVGTALPEIKIKQKSKEALEDMIKDKLVFSLEEKEAFIFDPTQECAYKLSLSELKDLLRGLRCQKVSYGLKKFFKLTGTTAVEGLFDVKIAAYLIDSALSDYSLETLVSYYLGQDFSQIAPETKPYFISRLYEILAFSLKKENLEKLFFDVEMPLVYILAKMQADGVRVDLTLLSSLLKEVDRNLVSRKKEIIEIAAGDFNLNSPKQLAKVLFEDLKIKPFKKTKTGYSTNEEVLAKLAKEHKIAKLILDYRHLIKLKTTYIIPLADSIRESKGILYAQFNQTQTVTGRLSSSSPNLQSIPVKGEWSLWLRKAFVPSQPEGYILSGDYSQIELRILAHLSGDQTLSEAFNKDLDIHAFTAGLLFGLKPNQINPQQRNIAKRVNFGIIYGMSSYGLARELKITPLEAQNFIEDYFQRYQGVKKYINKVYQDAEEKGFVETILGRKRKLPDIKSSDTELREFTLRQAINAPIQGSCADIIKVAMIKIDRELRRQELKSKLIMQIHDELIFDISQNELDRVKTLVKQHMEGSIKLLVPIKVNLKQGKNWGELQ